MTESPLSGVVVGVTADRCCEEQIDLLVKRGARVIHAPTLQTVPVVDEDEMRSSIDRLVAHPPEVVILATGSGVQAWSSAAHALGMRDALGSAVAGATVVAQGTASSDAAVAAGWAVDWTAASGQSVDVIDHLRSIDVTGKRVAVQLDGDEVAHLVEAISELGADVVPVSVHRWQTTDQTAPVVRLVEAAADGRVDAVTFTSAPAVTGLVEIAEKAGLIDGLRTALSSRVLAVCIGPMSASTAETSGFLNLVQPRRSRLSSMVNSLVTTVEQTQWSVPLGDSNIVIRASAIVVDGSVIDLAPRERDVLTRLARRPGAVVAKDVLVRHVWQDRAETHAVETVVNRLRRRLDSTAVRIMTVHKRGYCLAPA